MGYADARDNPPVVRFSSGVLGQDALAVDAAINDFPLGMTAMRVTSGKSWPANQGGVVTTIRAVSGVQQWFSTADSDRLFVRVYDLTDSAWGDWREIPRINFQGSADGYAANFQEEFTSFGLFAGYEATVPTDITVFGRNAGRGRLHDSEEIGGDSITAFGRNAGMGGQGVHLTAVGSYAAVEDQGFRTTAVGNEAGAYNTGRNVTVVGHGAGDENTSDNLTALGYRAGSENDAERVISIGRAVGRRNKGVRSVFIGWRAGLDNQRDDRLIIDIPENPGNEFKGGNQVDPLLDGYFKDGTDPQGYVYKKGLRIAGELRVAGNIRFEADQTRFIPATAFRGVLGSPTETVVGTAGVRVWRMAKDVLSRVSATIARGDLYGIPADWEAFNAEVILSNASSASGNVRIALRHAQFKVGDSISASGVEAPQTVTAPAENTSAKFNPGLNTQNVAVDADTEFWTCRFTRDGTNEADTLDGSLDFLGVRLTRVPVYHDGELVRFGGTPYESLVDDNMGNPTDNPDDWLERDDLQ